MACGILLGTTVVSNSSIASAGSHGGAPARAAGLCAARRRARALLVRVALRCNASLADVRDPVPCSLKASLGSKLHPVAACLCRWQPPQGAGTIAELLQTVRERAPRPGGALQPPPPLLPPVLPAASLVTAGPCRQLPTHLAVALLALLQLGTDLGLDPSLRSRLAATMDGFVVLGSSRTDLLRDSDTLLVSLGNKRGLVGGEAAGEDDAVQQPAAKRHKPHMQPAATPESSSSEEESSSSGEDEEESGSSEGESSSSEEEEGSSSEEEGSVQEQDVQTPAAPAPADDQATTVCTWLGLP